MGPPTGPLTGQPAAGPSGSTARTRPPAADGTCVTDPPSSAARSRIDAVPTPVGHDLDHELFVGHVQARLRGAGAHVGSVVPDRVGDRQAPQDAALTSARVGVRQVAEPDRCIGDGIWPVEVSERYRAGAHERAVAGRAGVQLPPSRMTPAAPPPLRVSLGTLRVPSLTRDAARLDPDVRRAVVVAAQEPLCHSLHGVVATQSAPVAETCAMHSAISASSLHWPGAMPPSRTDHLRLTAEPGLAELVRHAERITRGQSDQHAHGANGLFAVQPYGQVLVSSRQDDDSRC